MRVLVAGIGQFEGAPAAAPETGRAVEVMYAEAVPARYAGTATALGGFLAAAHEVGVEVLPMSVVSVVAIGDAAEASETAQVGEDVFETLRTRIFSELRGWKVDAVYLALGGATRIADAGGAEPAPAGGREATRYAEAGLIRSVHARLGEHVPMVVTLDTDPAPPVVEALAACATMGVTPAVLPGAAAAARGAAAVRRLREVFADEVRAPSIEEVWQGIQMATGPLLPGGPTGAFEASGARQPALQLVVPDDPAPAAAPGEVVPLGLSVAGLDGRTVSVGWFVCDEMGEVRWDGREERGVDGDPALLRFAWPVQRADPPGVYSLRGLVWSPEDRWQGIASTTMEVVDPATGRRATASRFPPVPRDRLLTPRGDFPPTAPATLEAMFHGAERASRAAHNADGSWGSESRDRRGAQHIAIFTRTAENAMAYLQAYRLLDDAAYAAEAKRGLDFLVETQLPNGGWCPWSFTWVTPQWVFLREACFYDTGGAARALLEGYRVLGDERYLQAVRRACDYALAAPYTGNNNYDAFLLWYLAPYAQLSGETRYLEHAVARCREAVLPGQQPHGGFTAHNLSTGYQAIIAYGLLALRQALPAGHPYAAALRRATVMALNFLLWLQDEQGNYYAGWEYDRTFGVTPDGRPRGSSTNPAGGRLAEVFRSAAEQFELDERIYRSLCHSVTRRWHASGAAGRGRGGDLLAVTSLLTWSHR